MTACTQPGCTGTIVDGYCDVCGSPANAPAFTPAAAADSPASWTKPIRPYRVVGNIYYVGSEGLSAWLISSSEGMASTRAQLLQLGCCADPFAVA